MMNDETSARWALPLLQSGQAQKELSHNEALTRLDLLVQGAVETVGDTAPPSAPEPGQCWIVGAAPSGAWSAMADHLAGWTSGGWRFVAPREGMVAWSIADGASARFSEGAWRIGRLTGRELLLDGRVVVRARQAAIAAPSGGSVIDAEARAAIDAILDRLRVHGLIAD